MRKLFLCFFVGVVMVWSTVLLKFGLQPRLRLLPDQLWSSERLRAERICAPLATILVNSASWRVSLRQVIRSTWGHPSILRPLGLRLAFSVGQDAPQHSRLESAAFQDLLLYPRQDTYADLPRKVAWALRETHSACANHDPKPPFVVKMDDDVFVNVYALQELLLGLVPETSQKKVWCLVWDSMPVIRSNNTKWYVSHEAYSDPTYPTYCSGAGYIFSSPALQAILQHENTTFYKTTPSATNKVPPPPATSDPSGVVSFSQIESLYDDDVGGESEDNSLRVTSESRVDDVGGENEDNSLRVTSESRIDDVGGDVVQPLIASEDVFITGLLARKAGLTHVQIGSRFAFDLVNKEKVAEGRTIFAHLGPEAEDKTEDLWDWMKEFGKKSVLEELDDGL